LDSEVARFDQDQPDSTISATGDEFVTGDPLAAPVVAVDGAVLPLTAGAVEYARSQEWHQYKVGKAFNSIFYAALRVVGVEREEVQAALLVMSKYAVPLKMTPIQVRVAYGVDKGVFGRHGKFLKGPLDGCDWEAKLMEARAQKGDSTIIGSTFSDDEWDRVMVDALESAGGLPDQVDIAVEFRWIRCNLHQAPWFKGAPSQGAIKDWLTVMAPGPDQKARQMKFTELAWNKRLTPGDKKAKPAAFKEDAAGESEADESAKMAEWNRRMFGKDKGDA
jgi:hypothetical protein